MSMNHINTILDELDNSEDLASVLRIIYHYYLTHKERELYEVFILYLNGKPQRELSILTGIPQSYLSVLLKKLKLKLRKLGSFLVEDRSQFEELLCYISENFSPDFYCYLSHIFAGNRYHQVSKKYNLPNTYIFYIIKHVYSRLPDKYKPLFSKAIDVLH